MENEDMYALEGPKGQEPSDQEANQGNQKKKRKPRGPSKGIKDMPGVPRIIEWDCFNQPIGKWVKEFKTHIGEISRTKVSILIKDWEHVSQGIKDTLWEDVKVTENVIILEYAFLNCLYMLLIC